MIELQKFPDAGDVILDALEELLAEKGFKNMILVDHSYTHYGKTRRTGKQIIKRYEGYASRRGMRRNDIGWEKELSEQVEKN